MRLLRAALPQLRLLRTASAANGSRTGSARPGGSSGRGGMTGGKGVGEGQRVEEGWSGVLIRPYEAGRRRGHSSTVDGTHDDALDFETRVAGKVCADEEDDLAVQLATPALGLPLSPWPRGTWDDPVPITSVTSSRAVACCGPPDGLRPHATVWVNVTEAHPVQCPTCRQVFKLSRRRS